MALFLNQSGFSKAAVKKAIFNRKVKEFYIVDNNNQIVFEGKTLYKEADENSGDEVSIADFSGLMEEGEYTIRSEGESARILIDDGADRNVLDNLCKAYYYLRCGINLEEKYAGKFIHKPCHCGKIHIWGEDNGIELEANGGWHDAGDYGRYVTAGAVAVAHLLNAFRLFPRAFIDQNLNIPESDSQMPDILEECRVELEWILKLQKNDGSVYHKLTTAHHAPFVMPEDDTAQLYMLPVSSLATADLTAVCALAEKIYRKYDEEFADRLKTAALLSAEWLISNPDFLPFKNPSGCETGEYGEWFDKDNRFWAACEMFAMTGEKKWRDEIKLQYDRGIGLDFLGYSNVGGLGAITCILNDNIEEKFKDRCREAFIAKAEELKRISDSNCYEDSMKVEDYHWGSNMVLMQNACIFAIADYINQNSEYKSYVQAQCDVLLGRNPLGISYVSNIGENSIQHPHLRPVIADGIDECIPGMVSGGPDRHLSDPFAKKLLKEGTSPMKCFADDYMCYSLNEITIYWNSPAVFVWGYLLKDRS